MELEPKPTQPLQPDSLEFAEPPAVETLELQPKEALDLVIEPASTEETSVPVEILEPVDIKLNSSISIPQKIQQNWQTTQLFFSQLAQIDRRTIDDIEMQPARIKVGLSFVGFGALGMVLLLLHISSIHPNYSFAERLESYWYQYIWFVCLGVAGLFMLGRESLRPVDREGGRQKITNAQDSIIKIDQ